MRSGIFLSVIQSIVSTLIPVFHEVNEGAVDHPVTTRRRVISGEVPVAVVVWASFLQPLDGLVNDFDFRFYAFRGDDFGNFVGNRLIVKRIV